MQENKVIVSVEDKGDKYGVCFSGTGEEFLNAITALITECYVSFAENHSREEVDEVFDDMWMRTKKCIAKEIERGESE